MADLSVQQSKQLDIYLKTHKNVSREQAINILFPKTVKTSSNKGLQIEKSGKTQRSTTKKTSYNLNTNSAKQGSILADKLYNQIEGASINANTIKLLKQINPENVLFVLDAYNKKTKGKESLAQAIDDEWGLDATTVKEYICPALVKLAKNKNISGIYFGDYMKKQDIKSLNNWINNASTQIKTSLGVNLAETTVIKKNTEIQTLANLPIKPQKPNIDKMVENYNERNFQRQGKELGRSIYKQINGLSDPYKTRVYLDRINQYNIVSVMKEYEKQSEGKENLIDGIKTEWGLNEQDFNKFLSNLYFYAERRGIKIKDIENSEDSFNIKGAKKLYARINNAEKGKIISLAPYRTLFGNQYYSKEFQKKTGVSIENAILNDPTISRNKKIDLVRNEFTTWASVAYGRKINISDIIKDANSDLQDLCNNKLSFSRYANLYDTTMERLRTRVFSTPEKLPTYKVNGKFDNNFAQGETGDCWLLAAIKGISRTTRGLKILNNSIKVNNNGTVDVHLIGVNKTYTISQKEINSATELSSGNGNVRAIEIAVNRYLRETYKNKNGYKASIDGNFETTAYKILTGKNGHTFPLGSVMDQIFNPDFYERIPISDSSINFFNNKNQITCVSSTGNKKDIKVKSTSDKTGILTTGHSYTVTHADQQFVYLINPWDTATELKVDRTTFKDFFTDVNKFDLS